MYHVERLLELVFLLLRVALGAVKPLFAARRANGGLNVEDVFAPGACGDETMVVGMIRYICGDGRRE